MNPSDKATQHGADYTARWVTLGGSGGLLTCLIYAALVIFQPSNQLGVTLAVAFGPLLAVASFGLRALLFAHRHSIAAEVAAVMNTIGGALFSTMLLV